MIAGPGSTYEYAVVSRALGGERQSGDASLVQATAGGVFVAVVDGLGHGEEAAAASGVAISTLREYVDEPLPALLQRCHDALLLTRGAAITLAVLDRVSATLTWAGVGNVEAVLIASGQGPPRDKLCLTNRSGVVGYRLPQVETGIAPIFPGDLLILATDGIDDRFISTEIGDGAPDGLARSLLDRYGKATDDALVLVLRWLGQAADVTLRTPP